MATDRFRSLPPFAASDDASATIASVNYFADEVAIDFPSLHRIVPRVRDRFLGAESDDDLLRAVVSLSHREAISGTIVPLEVPMRSTCVHCAGRGGTWAEHCGVCRGMGHALVHHSVRVTVPPGIAHGARLYLRVHAPAAASVRVEVRIAVRTPAA